MLTCLLMALTAAPARPPNMPPVITAGFTDTAPVIDGVLDDPCWAVSAVAAPFVLLSTAQFPTQRTIARICADERAVYVGFWCWEDAVDEVTTEARKNDSGAAWKDDCVEVFLAPDGVGRVYYHIIVTAANVVDDELCWRFGARRDMKWNAYGQTAVRRWRKGWTCEMELPLRYLGGAKPQGKWLANFARAEQPHGEFSSWAALLGGFHEPARFGRLNWAAEAAVANFELSPLSVGPAWVKLGWQTSCSQPTVRVRQIINGHKQDLPTKPTGQRWRFVPVPHSRSYIRIEASCSVASDQRIVFATPPIAYSAPMVTPLAEKLARMQQWVRQVQAIASNGRGPLAAQLAGKVSHTAKTLAELVAKANKAIHSQQPAGEQLEALNSQADELQWPTFALLAEAQALRRSGWASRPPLALGWQTSLVKLRRDDRRVHLSGPIQLSAARDEWESAQVVLVPLGDDVDVADVSVGPLVQRRGDGRIGAGCIRIWRVGYVHTRKPVYPVDYVGWWPDPLMPLKPFTVKARQIQPVWVSIYVPPDAPAGDYKGAVTVKLADGTALSWPLELRVWDFQLPRPSRLRTAFSILQRHDACLWYGWKGLPPKEFRMKFYRLMLEHRLNPMSLYTSEMFPPREDLQWCIEHGLNAFNIRTLDFVSYRRDETYQYIKRQAEWLKQRGWLPLAFVYGFDEVQPKGHQAVRDAYGRVHQTVPGLKTACTVRPCDDLAGYVDIWVPLTAAYDLHKAQQRRRAGDEVWWYICCGPQHPYANWFIDYPATDARVLFWQTFKYRVTGFLYYEVAMWRTNLITKPNANHTQIPPAEAWVRRAIAQGKRWPDIPWNTFTFARFNGDGLLIYPGRNETPLPSLRLEVIRDGIEDYDMLCVLRDLRDELLASPVRRRYRKLLAEATTLLAVRPTVARDLTHFTDDPRAIIREREAVARAILRIKWVLGKAADGRQHCTGPGVTGRHRHPSRADEVEPMTALAALWLAAAASNPRVEIWRGRAIPWVGATVEYQAVVLDAAPGSKWHIELVVEGAGVKGRTVGAGDATADAAGQAVVRAEVKFTTPGWYTVRARAKGPRARMDAAIRVPVTRRRVDFAWYQAEKGRELKWVTIQLTCGEPEDQRYWRRRGVLPARWCGAACGKDKPVEFFAKRWSSHDAIAIDEFGGGSKYCEKFYRALVASRKRNPHNFIAVWFCGCYDYWPRLRNLIDLFLPEVYLNYLTYDLGRFDRVVALARRAGVFDKLLVGLGINVVKNKDGSARYRPTPTEVVEEIRYLKQIAPDLRGLAFFTYGGAEPQMRRAVDEACRRYFIDPCVDIVSAHAKPELGAPGKPATVTVALRNVGGMEAKNVGLTVAGPAGARLAGAAISLKPAEQKELRLTVIPRPPVTTITASVRGGPGVATLRGEARLPVVRRRGREAVLFAPPAKTPSPIELPCELQSAKGGRIAVLRADASLGKRLPTDTIQTPDGGRRLVWLEGPGFGGSRLGEFRIITGGGATARADVTATTQVHGRIQVTTRVYTATLDPSSDAIVSLKLAEQGCELLASPWRVKWADWKGFGPPQVTRIAVGVRVVVPVGNDKLVGWSQYLFYPTCVEIERSFTAPEPLTVDYAGEGASVAQREGSFACQWAGAGTHVSRGRLQITKDYRDIYFGTTSLSGPQAARGGWFDFCWDKPRAGLGVAIAQMWQARASRAGYDVTRYYDGADWIEIAQVWHTKLQVRQGHWRIFLIPHGPLELSNPAARSPAQALWERLNNPPRLLRRQ